MNVTCWEELCLASVLRPWTLKLKCLAPATAARVHDANYKSQNQITQACQVSAGNVTCSYVEK